LTAIRQPVRGIGRRALEILLETDRQQSETDLPEEVLAVDIVVRSSVAPPSKQ
jgi:LacI family transcriptional regulator